MSITNVPREDPVRRFLTRNFRLSELACHDGTPVPDRYIINALVICRRAEALRAEVGPLIVTSGFRSAAWNRRIGGAKGSLHLTASALDLTSRKYSGQQLADIYLRLMADGQVPDGGVGRYPGWVHVDIGRPRRWTGTEKP